jgi:HEAT repeat protein
MTDRSVKSWRFADEEGSEAAKKLNRLRSELSSAKYTQAMFSSCDELKVKFIASIANLTKPLLTPTDLKREDELLKRIDDKNTAIRSRAKQSLIDMGSTQYSAVLIGRIRKPTKNEQRRIQDIRELLDITVKNSGVMPLLRVLLTYEDPVTKAQVIYQLGQQAMAGKKIDRDTTDAILNLSSDNDSSVRREVAHVMWKIFRLFQPEKDKKLFEKMTNCLHQLRHDSNMDVSRVAAYSISTLSRQGLM